MKPLKEYDKNTIVSKELIEEIFEEPDEIERSYMIADCSLRAKELDVLSIFKKLIAERAKIEKEISKPTRVNDRYTDFAIPMEKSFANMKCGSWVANENGVVSYNVMGMEQRACHHPILPIKRLINMESGEEKITLAFKRDYLWREIVIDKKYIASASKIVDLSSLGIAVTSENAKYLVRYLNDVECMNQENIELTFSTGKLGWNKNDFIPFDKSIVFDGEAGFNKLFESIKENGDYATWLNHIKELRENGKIEVKMMIASSFASSLVSIVDCLPFFVDLWGETEGGKSVSLMVAASIWAEPSAYIGNYINTDTSLEVRASFLNNIPMILDDSSNMNKKIREDIENTIYRITDGRGKGRSTKDLNPKNILTWKLVVLTSGERQLAGYVNQGGAKNRIIEIEASQKIFENPQKTAEIVKRNYGFAGSRFIEVIKEVGFDSIREMYKEICSQLFEEDKMQKQSMSLACILLADRLATEHIFKDGANISINDAKMVLIDRTELSENERCYRYLLDMIAMNSNRFDKDCQVEKWGMIENGIAIIYPVAFDRLCNQGGFSKKSFISWAGKKGVIPVDKNGYPKVKFIDGKSVRAIQLNLDESILEGFQSADDMNIPFE